MEWQTEKNSNPNKLSQSNNSIILSNLKITCQAQPHDLSSVGAFKVCQAIVDMHKFVTELLFHLLDFTKTDDIKKLDPK